MGAWGTAISSNDTYADIYSEFFDLYNDGLDVIEILKAVHRVRVSFSNPNESTKKIKECFLVALVNEELKIVSDFIVSSDAKEWRHVDGDEDKSLRLHNLGKPVKVERYLEPTDEWSLEEYLKDK